MTNNWEHSEGRPASMKDVQAILADLSKGERGNPPVLALNNRNLMKARNNGYPMEMYHETLEPVFSLTAHQTENLMAIGYVTHYVRRDYPRYIFRYNSDPKFAIRRDPATGEPRNHEHVEERLVKTQQHHQELLKAKVPKGCGPWVEKLTGVEPLPEPDEDVSPLKSHKKRPRDGELSAVSDQLSAS